VIVQQVPGDAAQIRQGGNRVAGIKDKHLPVEHLQQTLDTGVTHDAALINNGYVAAQALRLFQVVSGENNGSALGIDVAQELPHGAAQLDIHTGGWLIEDQ